MTIVHLAALALRLMTYNLNHANPDEPATLDAIAADDADVVLLQEVDAGWQRALEKRFAAALSKHPIDEEQLIPAPSAWFPASRLVIDGPFGAVQILNVHLRPAIDRGSWVRGYFTTRSIRMKEIEAYAAKLATMPTIIAGDFNEAPDGGVIAFLDGRGFTRAKTSGPTTWHYGDSLAIDIDHVLVDGGLIAKDAVVRDAGASDHRPVLVTISPR